MLEVEKAIFKIKFEMLYDRAGMNAKLMFGDYILINCTAGFIVQISRVRLRKLYLIRSFNGDLEPIVTSLYGKMNSKQIALIEPFFHYKLEREKIENKEREKNFFKR